jgi:quinol monooxygenase YgiN
MKKNIHLISRWIIKSGFQNEAEKALKSFEKMAKAESGTLLYMIHRPMWSVDLISNPTPCQLEVLFFEIYKNQTAFDKHVARQQQFMKLNGITEFFETPEDNSVQTASMVEFLDFERGFIKSDLKIK